MKRSLSRGFTIVELAVVVIIIGILATISVVTYGVIQADARDSKRQSDVIIMMSQLKKYYDENGTYPTDTDAFVVKFSTSGLNDPNDTKSASTNRVSATTYCTGYATHWGGVNKLLGPTCGNYAYVSGIGTSSSDNGQYGPGCKVTFLRMSEPYVVVSWYDENAKMIKFAGYNAAVTTNATSTAFPGQVCALTNVF